jgi:hypothetical protein
MVWLPSYTHRTRLASPVLHDRLRVLFAQKSTLFSWETATSSSLVWGSWRFTFDTLQDVAELSYDAPTHPLACRELFPTPLAVVTEVLHYSGFTPACDFQL